MHQLTVGIERLHDKLLEMGTLVEHSIARSVRALADRDRELASQVIADEVRVNQLEIEIDSMATRLFALQQPVARDLRFLTSAIKINTDLERIGDLAVTIARRSMSLLGQPELKPLIDIPHMASLAESMLSRSLQSFVLRDAELAREVLLSDDEVDALRDKINDELLGFMQNDGSSIARAIDLMFITRSLERIADHATNIAEDVVFLVRGIDVRHHAESEAR